MSNSVVVFNGRIPWLKGRTRYIGSSDGPAILGYGYSGQCKTTVWNSKVNDVKPTFDHETLKLMEEGRKCEPFVVERFRIEHPEWTVVSGTPFDLTICKEYPYLAASLDAEIRLEGETLPLEAKWIGRHMAWQWEEEQTPLKYQIQLMHQMVCMGARRGCIAAFVAGEYHERWMEWDQEVVDYMLREYREFWSHVIDRTPPDDSSPEAFRELRPAPRFGTAKIVGGMGSRKTREFLELDRLAREAQAKADRARNGVAVVAGDCEYLVLDDQSVVKLGKSYVKQIKGLPRGVTYDN